MRIATSIFALCLPLAFILVSCSANGGAGGPSAELELRLSFPGSSFAAGQPIQATVTLRNLGSESVVVNKRMGLNAPSAPDQLREVVFAVTDPGGRSVPLGARIDLRLPKEGDFSILNPGGSVAQVYPLHEFYAFDQPGEYSIQAIYQNSSSPPSGEAAWTGEVASDPVTITVR